MGLEPRQLNDLDEWLLDELRKHRSTPKLLRGRLETVREDVPSAGYINQRLRRLEEHDHLANLEGTGVYELVDDPREDGAGTDLEAKAIERQHELEEKEADLEDCREQLEQARADAGGTVDDQLITAIEDAHSAAVSAQDGQRIEAGTIDDIVRYLERAQEVIDK